MRFNKTKVIITICSILTLVISTSKFIYNVFAADLNYTRLYGTDRYETAISASQTGWPDGADYAVVVNGQKYADSFCAVPLAKLKKAPIILTEKDNINSKTIDELKRLKVKYIYLIGSQNDIASNVESQLRSKVTKNIERISGEDRYETSVKIAEKIGAPSRMILVSDEGYADALAVSAVAAIEGMPILVTRSQTIPDVVNNYVKSHNITETYVIGRAGAVRSLVPGAKVIQGQNRYETNINIISNFLSDFNFANVYASTSGIDGTNGFADSLVGAALAAKTNSPIVLVDNKLQNCTETFVKSNLFPNSKIIALASQNEVSDLEIDKFKLIAETLDSSNRTYSKDILGNANIVGDNINFNGKISGNLYICGNNSYISDTEINGTIFIDPGMDGTTKLDNIKAKNIVVLSGTKDNGIYLTNVKVDELIIRSSNNVKITAEQGTKIGKTIVDSQAIVESIFGEFGDITVTSLFLDKPVEFSGGFGKPIVVTGSTMIKTRDNTEISQLDITPTSNDKKVIVHGMFTNIQVNKGGNLLIDGSTKVTDSIKVNASSTLYGNGDAKINLIDISPINNDTINLSSNFGITDIKVNASSKINVTSRSFITKIKVDPKALLVNINVSEDAEVQVVDGDAIVSGAGAKNTIKNR